MSFGQKLLNATSKNYFSAIYFTSTSLQPRKEPFLLFLILYFNIFFRVILYVRLSVFCYTNVYNLFLVLHNAYNYFYKILISIKSTSIDD